MRLAISASYFTLIDLSVMMSISQATQHLANSLSIALKREDPQDPAVQFLDRVASIVDYLEKENLVGWEAEVLSFPGLDELEARSDFEMIEVVWEVGRSNLFGAIEEKTTEDFYLRAKELLSDRYGIVCREASEFDFKNW